MIPNQFSHALRTNIAERFGDGQAFTIFDFTDLAASFGKPIKSVTHILRDMHGNGLLGAMGEQPNKHGGSNTKRYAVIEGAQLTLKTTRDYQLEALHREQSMNRAALALHAALDRMTRGQRVENGARF